MKPITITGIIALLLTASVGCKKSGSSSSSSSDSTGTGSNGALLTEEILVATNSANVTIDSTVTTYSYDGNNNLTGLQQNSSVTDSGASFTTNLTYSMTYSGNLISGLTGSVAESVVFESKTYSATTQVNTTFQSGGGKIVAYVQKTSTTGTTVIPTTSETANDSALLTYNTNGSVATYTVYQLNPLTSTYLLNSQESFTYSGNNLSQSINVAYDAGRAVDTFASVYTYDTKLSAAPLYLVPGVAVLSVNDLTQSSVTETGANPGSVITNYTTTYNAANQPATSTVTVATTPSNPGAIAKETITYTYKN
jgi:hypothetical protein